MKILILSDGITPLVIGGMQKHSFNLAKQLALQGHSICLFHCVTGKNKLPEREDLVAWFGNDAMQNIESICMRFPELTGSSLQHLNLPKDCKGGCSCGDGRYG